METVGLLLMAYGSPESTAQMEAYLLDVREGRPPSEELVHEISSRYELIGGRSPLLNHTREQAERLAETLNNRHQGGTVRFRAYVGMRHWEPRIKAAVDQMVGDGIQQTVSIVMAPHNSNMSIGKYYQVLNNALNGHSIEITRIQSWYDHLGFLDAISENIGEALSWFDGKDPYVIFTAHSLPAQILADGDPYDDQLNETARWLAKRFELPTDRWQFCYQSAGASAVPWLGPQIEDVVQQLAQAGQENLLVVPVGFVCDHVEVLYDIDIGAREIGEKYGARLERAPSLNSSPTFINALADLIEQYLPAEVRARLHERHA